MGIITTSLNEYVKPRGGQASAARQLNMTKAAISAALSRGTNVQVTYDEHSRKIVAAYKIVPFGSLQKVDDKL